jgi:hypothetical protein
VKILRSAALGLGLALFLAGLVWCAAGAASGATNHVTVFGGDRPLHWPRDLDRSLGPGFLSAATGFLLLALLSAKRTR